MWIIDGIVILVLKVMRKLKTKVNQKRKKTSYLICPILPITPTTIILQFKHKRWSHRGYILMVSASKVKSLALKPQVLQNCPVLGSRTAAFLELLKFCRLPSKIFWRTFFLLSRRTPEKNFEDLFFWEYLSLCSWSLALASRGSVLGRAVLTLGLFLCPWPWPRALCPRLHLCYTRHKQKFGANVLKRSLAIRKTKTKIFFSPLLCLGIKGWWYQNLINSFF